MYQKMLSAQVVCCIYLGTVFKISIWEGLLSDIRSEIVSEYDQEIPQSQTADNPVAPRGRAAQPSQDTRKTN